MQAIMPAMISRKIAFLLAFILLTSFVPSLTPRTLVLRLSSYHASFSDDPSIDVLGVAWADVNLKVLVVKPSWLSRSYVDSVVKAFKAWDRSLESFGNSYGYPYLSKFSFYVTVSSASQPGYDITVEFSQAAAQPGGEIGEAIVAYIYGRIVSVKIILYVYTTDGKLSPVDVFNIALHEIGHALGLNHASSSSTINGPEVMYPVYSYPKMELRPSTLDAYALAKVYAWLATGSFVPPSKRTISLPSSIPYRMLLYYKLTVVSEYGNVSGGGWYLEGALATVKLDQPIVELSKGVRAVFRGWTGDVKSRDVEISIKIYRDTTIKALWKIQYFVNISTAYANASVSSGWYDEGTELKIELEDTFVYLDNETRAVFLRWVGAVNSSSPQITLVVDKPLFLEAVWQIQFWVEIRSAFSSPVNASGWYNLSEKLTVGVKEPVLDLSNDTRYVVKGWRGTLNVSGAEFEVTVDSPLRLEAIWVREYYVEIVTAYGAVSPGSGWYEEGCLINLTVAEKIVDQGNGTRRVFWRWLVNNREVETYPLRLRVNSSLKVAAEWRTQYLISFKVLGEDGREVDAIFNVSHVNTVVRVNSSGEKPGYWLYRGTWNIGSSLCRLNVVRGYVGSIFTKRRMEEDGFLPCKAISASFKVAKPGVVQVVFDVQNVTLVCRDFLGIPSPFLSIKLLNYTLTSDIDGFIAYFRIPKGKYSTHLQYLGFKLGDIILNVEKPEVVIIYSPPSIYLIIVLVTLLVSVWAYIKRGRSKNPKKLRTKR